MQPATRPEPMINSHGRAWHSEKALFLDEDVFMDTLVQRIHKDYHHRMDAIPLRPGEDIANAGADILELLSYELPSAVKGKPTSLIYMLGALAGFSSQMSVRETMIDPVAGITENSIFETLLGSDGRSYFFSSAIDLPLYDTRPRTLSVARMINAAARSKGAKTLPDVIAIRDYYKDVAGSSAYKYPRVSAPLMPRYDVFIAVGSYWNITRNYLLSQRISPLQWPKAFGSAIADAISARSNKLDPEISAVLAAEGMVAGAYIDPAGIRHALLGIKRHTR